MRSKHTPGPWKANLYLGGAYAINRMAPNGERLGRIAVVDGMIETKANARLIAAAPDLLEAAKNLLAMTEGQTIFNYMEPQLEAVRAAIAKAGGGTRHEKQTTR